MSIRHTVLAAALAAVFAGPIRAEALEPVQAQAIELGAATGVAYYTVERDGFHVVATLASPDGEAAPLRLEATLAPGQSVVLSTPRDAGAPADAVEISRRTDTVLVRRTETALTN